MNCATRLTGGSISVQEDTPLESLLNQVDNLCRRILLIEVRLGEIEAYIRTHPVPFDTPLELD